MLPAVPLHLAVLAWLRIMAPIGAVLLATAACQPEDETLPLPGNSGGPGSGSRSSGHGGGPGGGSPGEGGGAAVPPCSSLEGPFGSEPASLLDPSTTWEGFLPGAVDASPVAVEDLVACGGNAETRALVVYIDAVWCDVCRNVASGLADTYASSWRDRGVAVVSLLVEDGDGNPADIEEAWLWRSTYGLEEMTVAVDPAYVLANASPDTLPQALVVDPRTMRIHARTVGNVDLEPLLDQVLAGDGE